MVPSTASDPRTSGCGRTSPARAIGRVSRCLRSASPCPYPTNAWSRVFRVMAYGVLLLAVPAVAHHKPLQWRASVGAIRTVGPAERNDGGTLDMVGDAEDSVELCFATAVQGREHGAESKGAGGQHEVLHTRIDRGASLKSGLPRGGLVHTGHDQHRGGRERLTHTTCRWQRGPGGGARLLVHLTDRVLHTGVADHNEVPGLGIGAGGAMDRRSQDLIDECVRDILRGEVADRTLVAKQLMHVGNRLHRKTPYWCGPRPVRRGTHGGHVGQTWAWCSIMRR